MFLRSWPGYGDILSITQSDLAVSHMLMHSFVYAKPQVHSPYRTWHTAYNIVTKYAQALAILAICLIGAGYYF